MKGGKLSKKTIRKKTKRESKYNMIGCTCKLIKWWDKNILNKMAKKGIMEYHITWLFLITVKTTWTV